MVDEVQLLRAAADVFVRRVDEVDADVVLGAGPAPGGELVHDGVVAVFVLDGVLVDAGAEDALLLGVDHDAVARSSSAVMSMLRSLSTESQSKVGFISRMKRFSPKPDGGIRGLVGVLGVGVEAAGAALQGVARFDVHAAVARPPGP